MFSLRLSEGVVSEPLIDYFCASLINPQHCPIFGVHPVFESLFGKMGVAFIIGHESLLSFW